MEIIIGCFLERKVKDVCLGKKTRGAEEDERGG